MRTRGAVFFDRDDTLTVDLGYTYRPQDLQWMPGALDSLKRLRELDIDAYIVTNQGGIARGIFSFEQMDTFHNLLRQQAEEYGGWIKDIAFCPHHPLATLDELRCPCECRKPAPGLILELAKKWNIDLTMSALIGDRETDVLAGKRAGCHTYLVRASNLARLVDEVIEKHFPIPHTQHPSEA